MRRALVSVFSCLACAASLAFSAPTYAADSAEDCVAVSRTEQSSGLDLELQNNCDKGLSCSLGWTLSCENASGKTTSRARVANRFSVAASTNHHEAASSLACNGGWKIDDVTWSCNPIK